jgi:hypothetical protein
MQEACKAGKYASRDGLARLYATAGIWRRRVCEDVAVEDGALRASVLGSKSVSLGLSELVSYM